MARPVVITLATVAIAVMCHVAQAKKTVGERLHGEREKRQVTNELMNYGAEKTLMIIEGKRQNASEGEFYSVMTRTYEKCDISCDKGTYMQGLCGMDCRMYYLTSRVQYLEVQHWYIVAAVVIISVIALVGFLGTCYCLYDMRDGLRKEIKQQKLHRHPTSTACQPEEEVGENVAFMQAEGVAPDV